MRIAALLALLLAGSGCEAVRYGCFNACLGASGGYKGTTHVNRPDRSTTHCDALPGKVFRAENGDELSFREGRVEWKHGTATETRTWRCTPDRTLHIEGFTPNYEGMAVEVETGVLHFAKAKYRIVGGGSTYVFPCELLPGHTFFAETGETLTFAATGKSVVWSRPVGGEKTLAWTCNDRDLRFRDGTVETAVPYVPEASAFVRWNGVRFDKSLDGKRPVFGCELLAGRTFRRPDSGDVLSFGGANTAEWRRATGTRTLSWTCFDWKITFREGATTTTEGNINPLATRVCYESYCYDLVPAP